MPQHPHSPAYQLAQDRVLVKPNIGWDRTPAQAGNTDPQVVAAVVSLCLEAGAGEVLVLDRTTDEPQRCYSRSGIGQAAGRAGAKVVILQDKDFREVQVGGSLITTWPVCVQALEADRLINVPVAKHHHLTRLTLGMKNFYGLLGGPRHEFHPQVHLSIAELTAFFAPVLTVVDAVRILVANGPLGGSLADVRTCNTVIASTDPVAADARAAALFRVDPQRLQFLVYGQAMGLGEISPAPHRLREIRLPA